MTKCYYTNRKEYIDITEHNDSYIVHIPCSVNQTHSVKKKHFTKDNYGLLSMEKLIKCNLCSLSISISSNQIRDA